MDNVKLRDYLKSNKEILNSRSKTEGILLDYYGGNQQIVKRLMKGYDCGVVSIFLNNELDEIKKNNFIGRLVREEDLIENVARDIYNEWQNILTDGNVKQLIKSEANNKNSKEKIELATISIKTKNSPITLSNTSIKKKQVTLQKKKQKNKSAKKGNALYNGNKQKDKSDSKRVDSKNDLTQLYKINKKDSDKYFF